MKFPTWNEFTAKLIELEQTVNKQIGKKISGFQDDHVLVDKALKTAIKFLPSPFDAIADTIYNTGSGSEEDKIMEVITSLNTIRGQGEDNYNKLSTQISSEFKKLDLRLEELKNTAANEKTLLLIRDTLLSTNQNQVQRLDKLREDLEVTKAGIANIEEKLELFSNKASHLGFTLLGAEYFDENRNTSPNLEDWLNGYVFSLSSIFYDQEYRREAVVENMKNTLEKNGNLFLIGQTGVSKSTIFMEIICDYFKKGYSVLFNEGNKKLADPDEIAEFIRGLVRTGKNVLVAIEDLHNVQMGSFYYIIKLLESYQGKNKIKLLMTARQPDLDSLVVSQKKFELSEKYRISLDSFFRTNKIYPIPYFTLDEIKEFITKYEKYFNYNGKSLSENALKIFSDTQGHPTLVKFYITGGGLTVDVENRYARYLCGESDGLPNLERIKTVILCSLVHFSNLNVPTHFLRSIGLIEHAENLVGKLLFNYENSWNTLHPRWDLELLSFLSGLPNIKDRLIEIFSTSISHILNYYDDDAISTILNTIIDPIIRSFFSIDLLEEIIERSTLSLDLKSRIYGQIVAPDHLLYHEIPAAIACFDKAINMIDTNETIYYNAGLAYHQYGVSLLNENKFEEAKNKFVRAVDLYDKAFLINPKFAVALSNKANTLLFLQNLTGAKNAVDIAAKLAPEDDIIWYNKGMVHLNLQQWQEAISAFDNTTSINEEYIHAWFYKAVCYSKMGNQNKASECLDKVTKLDPNFPPLEIFHLLVHRTVNNSNESRVKLFLQDPTEPIFSKYYTPRQNKVD